MSGSLTLHLVEGDDSSVELSRVLLRRAMDQDELLTPKSPEVVKVRYLADSIGDATSDQPLAAVEMPGGATQRGGIELSPVLMNCIAGVIGVIVAGLLTMIFVKLRSSRKRKRGVDGGDDLAGGKNDEVTLHVSNIAPETPDGFLREVFEQHGVVHEYCARTDDDNTLDMKRLAREEDGSLNEPFGPESSRQALVTMDKDGARSAAEYADGIECDGYVLRVREADDVDWLAFRDVQAANGGGMDPRERNLMDGCSLMDGMSIMSGSIQNDPRRIGLGGTMSAIEEGDEVMDGGGEDDAVVRGSPPSGRRTPGMIVGGALAGALGVRSLGGRSRRRRNELAEIGVDVSSHGDNGSRDPEADLDRFVEAMSRLGPVDAEANETDDGDESSVAEVVRTAAMAGDVVDARSYLAEKCIEFTDYDFSSPGQQHSTNHVPCCKRGTCMICRSPGTGIVFVKTEG